MNGMTQEQHAKIASQMTEEIDVLVRFNPDFKPLSPAVYERPFGSNDKQWEKIRTVLNNAYRKAIRDIVK